MKNISNVPLKAIRFGEEVRVKAKYTADHFEGFVIKKCTKQTNEPQNYIPYSDAKVIGENNDQKIFYDVFATMNSEIPEPSPYPSFSIESKSITMTPANIS